MILFILDCILLVLMPLLLTGLFFLLARYLSLGQALVSFRKAFVIAIFVMGAFFFAVTDADFLMIFQAAVLVGLPLVLINHYWLYLDFGHAILVAVVFMAYTMSIYEGVPRALDAISPQRQSVAGVVIETLDQYTLGKLEAHEQEEELEEAQRKKKRQKKQGATAGEPAKSRKREEKKEKVRDRFMPSKTMGAALVRAAKPTENVDFTFGFAGIMSSGYETMDKVKGLQANAARRAAFIDNLNTDTLNQGQMNDRSFDMADPFAKADGQMVEVAPLSAADQALAQSTPVQRQLKAAEQPRDEEAAVPPPPGPKKEPKGLLAVFGDVMETVKGGEPSVGASLEVETTEEQGGVESVAANSVGGEVQSPKDIEAAIEAHSIPFNLRGCDPEIKLDGAQNTAALKRLTGEERARWSAARSQIKVRSVMKLSMGTSAAFINDQLKVPGDTILVTSEGIDLPYQVISIHQYEIYFCPFAANGRPDRGKLLRLRI